MLSINLIYGISWGWWCDGCLILLFSSSSCDTTMILLSTSMSNVAYTRYNLLNTDANSTVAQPSTSLRTK